jgi:hypothetical protein
VAIAAKLRRLLNGAFRRDDESHHSHHAQKILLACLVGSLSAQDVQLIDAGAGRDGESGVRASGSRCGAEKIPMHRFRLPAVRSTEGGISIVWSSLSSGAFTSPRTTARLFRRTKWSQNLLFQQFGTGLWSPPHKVDAMKAGLDIFYPTKAHDEGTCMGGVSADHCGNDFKPKISGEELDGLDGGLPPV